MIDVGKKAPDFTLMNAANNPISLKSFTGKWVILYFYPKDNTSGCTKEAIDFTEFLESFSTKSAVIIGISPDSSDSHKKFISKHSLTVELLSDPDHKVLEMYGDRKSVV